MRIIKKHLLWVILLGSLGGVSFLAAQEEPPEEEEPGIAIRDEYRGDSPTLYQFGDKTFIITAGVIFPTLFYGEINPSKGHNFNAAGGAGMLSFNYYLSPHVYLGLELGGMFLGTKGENMFFMVPFGLRLGYQFILKRFEFPFTLMVGGAPQKYLEKGYFGLILKGGVGVFWRFNPDWSFGLNTDWWYTPQQPKNGKNVQGNFVDLTLSARYHF
jgi:hypothetical protein